MTNVAFGLSMEGENNNPFLQSGERAREMPGSLLANEPQFLGAMHRTKIKPIILGKSKEEHKGSTFSFPQNKGKAGGRHLAFAKA